MSDPEGKSHRFSQASVFIRETGDPDGSPLLLINGLGAHSGMWASLERALDGFRILEFDLPGAGQSEIPKKPVSLPDLAQLAAGVMDHFEMEQADVLGYSMGGMVAQQLAADLPERVRRLALVATTPGKGAIQVELKVMANIMTPARYSSPTIWAKSIGSLVGGRARYDQEWIQEQARLRFSHKPSWRGYMGQMRSMAGWSGLPLLPSIQHPTLVVSGEDDPLAPAINGMMIAHLLPNGRLLVLEGEGHLLVMDEDSKSHAAIREFFTAEPLESAGVWSKATTVDAEEMRSALDGAGCQIPPLSILDTRARRRWLRLEKSINAG